jgi:hypothetical protein
MQKIEGYCQAPLTHISQLCKDHGPKLQAWGPTAVFRWGLLRPMLRGAPVWHRFADRLYLITK